MITKRTALFTGMLFLLLFTTACGAAAPATQAPAELPPGANYEPKESAAATEAPAAQAPSLGAAPFATQSPNFNQPNSSAQPSGRSPDDMFFEDYGVNPSIDAEDDNLSTFALDVDTGSYTIMRNYLKDGNLPPSDSVRVEEYVNYFAQGYPNPPAHQAFGINIDGAPSPFTETERYQMMRVGIQGYQVPGGGTQGCRPDVRDRCLRLDGHGQPPWPGQALPRAAGRAIASLGYGWYCCVWDGRPRPSGADTWFR